MVSLLPDPNIFTKPQPLGLADLFALVRAQGGNASPPPAQGAGSAAPASVAGQVAASSSPQGATPQGAGDISFDSFVGGIAHNETGGERQPYGSVVSTGTGHKVYGRYQIYDANIGPWTEAALGKAMSPREFLASPDAQEATARYKLGEYVNKYGYHGAARAWLAGEGGMNNPVARDRFGSTPYSYADKALAHARAAGISSPALAYSNEAQGGAPKKAQTFEDMEKEEAPATQNGQPSKPSTFDEMEREEKPAADESAGKRVAGAFDQLANEKGIDVRGRPDQKEAVAGAMQQKFDPYAGFSGLGHAFGEGGKGDDAGKAKTLNEVVKWAKRNPEHAGALAAVITAGTVAGARVAAPALAAAPGVAMAGRALSNPYVKQGLATAAGIAGVEHIGDLVHGGSHALSTAYRILMGD